MKKIFNNEDIKAFEPENKIGILATVNSEGLPHLTLITTMQAKTQKQLFWGQFVEGQSKKNIQKNHRAGFLIMTPDRKLWRGKADWTHFEKEGKDYEHFNNLAMWRYNAYFGIHTIHYMDLIETTQKQALPLGKIIYSSMLTKFSKKSAHKKKMNRDDIIMNQWTQALFNRIDSLKYLSYVDEDGYPVIIPVLQCQAADTERLVFHLGAYKRELSKIKPDKNVAIFGLTLSMEDVLVRGTFKGVQRSRGISIGAVDVNWVYNSMPPIPGQIYPEVPVEEVVNF